MAQRSGGYTRWSCCLPQWPGEAGEICWQEPHEVKLARTVVAFPTTAHILLCSALVVRTTVISHQCFVYWWAVLTQHQDCFSKPMGGRLGAGGGDIAREADLNWPKGYSIPCSVTLNNKCRKREGERKTLIMKTSGLSDNCYAYLGTASQDVAEHFSMMGKSE